MDKREDALVVIPAYNEEKTISEVIRRTIPFADVCVVNDASRDNTEEIIKSFKDITSITHQKNTHIPQALLDGMRYGLTKDYRYIITMDAGLTHKPEELPKFLDYPDCDLVIGVRTERKNVPLFRRLISRGATFLINLSLRPIGSHLPPPRFHDVTSGYRRYSRKAAELLLGRKLKAKTFDFHTEALMILYRNGLSIGEVPISYEFSTSSFNMRVLKTGFEMYLDMTLTRRK